MQKNKRKRIIGFRDKQRQRKMNIEEGRKGTN
jgi:hypothetical protein